MPGYSDLHWALVKGIPYLPTRSFRVLELGVGTGTLTKLLLSEFPHAEVEGIDVSPRMIVRARARLRRFGDRVTLRSGRLEQPWDGEYDAIVSALAIHHLKDPAKWSLFRRAYRSLAPGGYFGDGDDHLPEDPVFDSRYSEIVAARLRAKAGSAAWTLPQQVWHEHEKFDRPCTVASEVVALERAGFAHVGVPWRFFGQAVVWAYR